MLFFQWEHRTRNRRQNSSGRLMMTRTENTPGYPIQRIRIRKRGVRLILNRRFALSGNIITLITDTTVLALFNSLRLPPRPVLVIGMIHHVLRPQPLSLVDERPLLHLAQQLPLDAQPLRNLRIVHLGMLGSLLAPLQPRPHHKSVHRSLDVALLLRLVSTVRLQHRPTAGAIMAVCAMNENCCYRRQWPNRKLGKKRGPRHCGRIVYHNGKPDSTIAASGRTERTTIGYRFQMTFVMKARFVLGESIDLLTVFEFGGEN